MDRQSTRGLVPARGGDRRSRGRTLEADARKGASVRIPNTGTSRLNCPESGLSSSEQRGARDHPGNPDIEDDARSPCGLQGCVLKARGPRELGDPRPQPSIDVRHEALTCYLWTLVVAIGLTRRQRNLDGVQVVVRDSRQQMSDAIEPGLFLVVGVHTYHGLTLVSVRANIRSFACE
jgi:hypothetical protein